MSGRLTLQERHRVKSQVYSALPVISNCVFDAPVYFRYLRHRNPLMSSQTRGYQLSQTCLRLRLRTIDLRSRLALAVLHRIPNRQKNRQSWYRSCTSKQVIGRQSRQQAPSCDLMSTHRRAFDKRNSHTYGQLSQGSILATRERNECSRNDMLLQLTYFLARIPSTPDFRSRIRVQINTQST